MSEGRERETIDLRKFRDEKLEEHELIQSNKEKNIRIFKLSLSNSIFCNNV